MVSKWLLFNGKSAVFQVYHGEDKSILNEMMMRSALYWANTLNWIFIVVAHRNKSANRHVAPFEHIILILRQPVFALSTYAAIL
jgi:hypothetical protein